MDDTPNTYGLYNTEPGVYNFAQSGHEVPSGWTWLDDFKARTSLEARYFLAGYVRAAMSRDKQLAVRAEQSSAMSAEIARLETLRAEHGEIE